MKVLFILGHKLTKDGELSDSYRCYLTHAAELIKRNDYHKVSISGGRTRRSVVWSEAKQGARFLHGACGVKRGMMMEEKAGNMSENFIHLRSMFRDDSITELTIVGRSLWKMRAKSIFAPKFFPNIKPSDIHYESPRERIGFFEILREAWNCLYATFDPMTKNPLARLGLRVFRNRYSSPLSVS